VWRRGHRYKRVELNKNEKRGKTTMRKRILGLALTIAMIVSILPMGVTPVSAAEYPTALVDGGFEYPVLSETPSQWWTVYNSTGGNEALFGWKTTASDTNFEFGGEWNVPGWGVNFIPEGRQFVELNASEQAAVYQDLTTTPGEVIYWSLYQGGVWYPDSTDINNTMAVRIGTPGQLSTETMKSINLTAYDQEWNKRAIFEIATMNVVSTIPETYNGKDGNKKQLYTEPKRWTKYEGVYIVPDGQTVTRFSFASLSDSPLQGNLLDGVVFRVATQEEIDALTVTTAKTTIEGATYTMTQAAATDEAAVKAAIDVKIATLALDGVTATISEVLYTPAIAGDAVTPSGTNGTYTFTISLSKGAAATTTVTLTMTVMATTYVAPTDVEITGFDAISNRSAGTAGSATYGNTTAVIAALPTSATANASAVTVPVTTWIDTDSYNPTLAGSYTFTATLGAIPTGFANIGGYTATVEVVVTVAPYVTPIPSTPSNNTGNVEKNIGQIIKDQQLDKSVPNTNVNNSTEELKSSVFTTEELAKIEAGEDAKVILKVTDINNSVSEDDKKIIAKNLDQGTSVMYIDLSLYKKVGDGTETKITETKNKISISIEIPVELRGSDMAKNRTYKIVRIHDGVVTIIEGTYDPVTYLFTFETDRFSTYALAYKDANVDTDSGINDKIITNDFFPLRLTAEAAETSQKLTYTKASEADGYIIYSSPCGINNKMVKLADVSGKTTSYSHKGLKKAKYYKYYIQAYNIINGKKVVIATSKVIHSVTTSKTYANPTKIVSDTSAVILTVGTSQKVTCKVVLPNSKKMDNHASVLRYEITNKAIATVTQSGKIKAISEGTCYIYAYAQNGVYKKIKVTVK